MRIQATKTAESAKHQSPARQSASAAASFAQIFKEANAIADSTAAAESNLMPVGVISDTQPTVSDLLINNSQFHDATWKIIYSKSNARKNYARMQPGTMVAIDRQTLELVWDAKQNAAAVAAPPPTEDQPSGPQGKGAPNLPSGPADAAAPPAPPPDPTGEETGKKVLVGRLAGKHVSIAPDSLSSHLVRAVRSYLGRSYREINCYGLVVRGLRRLGIKYVGHGGLQNQLVQMAKSKGLPDNAYMTGEGLIEASGEKVFTTTLNKVKNIEQDADTIYRQMEPYLQKGYILSFSTPTRGHTGVISQHDQTWTFINSGYLDNQIAKAKRSKGVGEEVLAGEIRNWCKVAARKRQSLVVTLGRLEEEKLRTARLESPASGKVL